MKGKSTIGRWTIDWDRGRIGKRNRLFGRRASVDSRLLAVLGTLAEEAGKVLSTEELLKRAWPDRIVNRDSVSTAIYQLRQILGDSSQHPSYIKTEGRRGYRLVAPVLSSQIVTGKRSLAYIAAFSILMTSGLAAWHANQNQVQPVALVFVEKFEDQTRSGEPIPLHSAIETTLFGELVNRLPGQVVNTLPVNASSLTLKPTIVACDLGPALVLNLMDDESGRFVWSEAYPLTSEDNTPERPTLVQKIAEDVSNAVLAL